MSEITKRVTDLSAQEKRALLARLLRQQTLTPKTFPLSFAQERLWFLDQLVPGSIAYNIAAAVRLCGPLKVAALEEALNEVVRRHDVLRATCAATEGRPIQVIAPTLRVPLSVLDLREFSEVEQESEVQRLTREEARRSFNLVTGPLLRVTLLRLREEEHMGLVTVHHIVSDGWSTGVFIRELAALYVAFSTGQPSPLPELPIQYADFAVWQRQWLQGKVLETQLAYWQQQLAGAPPLLVLPTDYPRPAVPTFRGATQALVLSPTLTTSLKRLSRQEGVTLFMTLLAAFKTLLHRYAGQGDIVVGTPIANRTRAETEGLIGLFVNTLVLRTDCSDNPSFRELLGRVRKVCLEAYAHQDLPFEKLVEALQPERDPSRHPLFQVMFVLHNAPLPVLDLPNLTLSPMEIDSGTALFDVTLHMVDTEPGLRGWFIYNTDLFDTPTVTRLGGHFQTLLQSIVTHPEQRISTLPLLTEAERQQLLREWNDTQAEYAKDACIHQLFEAQVERTPDAIAVVFENEHLTYRELNRRANQLAHYLRALGVGPEVLVGLCLERSLEMIIGLLGILKAGGAYVPLDPAYPQERLAFMVENAQISVLLTQQRLVASLPASIGQVVCLDDPNPQSAIRNPQSEENPVSGVTADNLAYIIYTSGSTGRPKGVMIQHRSLVNHTESASVAYALQSTDRVLQFASISFDASAEEIYPCLTRGATLVLRSEEMLESPSRLMPTSQDWSLTVVNLPTAYWHHITPRLGADLLTFLPFLRVVIIGGERALPERLAMWQQQVGERVRLVNTYGPTEATIVATRCELSRAQEGNTASPEVPIGRAIANVQVYVLDQSLQPVPLGVPGELHISGAGLARGYLNQPELTAEKFVPNPFGDEPGTCLYRTGDLARYRPDGNLEFLGRVDDQVKIRGFRVEPKEVEAVLRQHPAVRETVVVAREDGPGNNQLVAYLIEAQGLTPTVSELRTFLRETLPEYMVPSVFVRLDAVPLTPTGKVDHRALPAPERNRPDLAKAFVAPRTPAEETIARIWTEVLGREHPGIQDNFFELGGHSLLATQIAFRLHDAFGIEIPLRTIFEKPTIEELALAVEEILLEEIETLSEDEARSLVNEEP